MNNWVRWLLGLVLGVVGVVFALIILDQVFYSRRSFDRELWRAGDVHQRARMVVDIRISNLLVGKTRDEVSALLGTPDGELPNKWMYHWVTGSILGDLMPYSDWLQWMVVEFDVTTGRVLKVYSED